MFYHFTCRENFRGILSSEVLLTTESNVGSPIPDWKPFGANYGPPVVWLLDTPEINFDHGLSGGVFDKTTVRIAVDVPAIRWLDWEPASRMHYKWKKSFIKTGGGQEAASHWYVWPLPIKKNHWVEILVNGYSQLLDIKTKDKEQK